MASGGRGGRRGNGVSQRTVVAETEAYKESVTMPRLGDICSLHPRLISQALHRFQTLTSLTVSPVRDRNLFSMLFTSTMLAAVLVAIQQCAAVAVKAARDPISDAVDTGSISSLVKRKDWESPVYKYIFGFPLPIPPVKTPKYTVTNPVTNKPIDYYEVNILPLQQQVYPNLGLANLVGYDGISPGPTFRMERGREAVVRFVNKASMANSVHLHGSYSVSPTLSPITCHLKVRLTCVET